MERINFPQISGQSDLVNPLDPGRYQYDFMKRVDELEQEYRKKGRAPKD